MLVRFLLAISAALKAHVARWQYEYAALSCALIVIVGGLYFCFFAPPSNFPIGETVYINSGATLDEVAAMLAEKHLIRSPRAFEYFIRAIGKSGSIDAGSYRFERPLTALTIASRILRGETGIAPVEVTFPEGISVREMAEIFSKSLSQEFGAAFKKAAAPHEGFLFPDTYHLTPRETPESIALHMREIFAEKVIPLGPLLSASERSLSDIVTMASLLEWETNTDVDSRIVAGILWKRLGMGMPLQVDAVFGYIKGKSGYAPTLDDLKIDSPYNTYLYKGLPPTPIGNPGIKTITASLEPTKTSYLYYLTGKDGEMHYASTFEGHQLNREKYLR